VFWEIARQELRKFGAYWRQQVPWWLCRFFCTDVARASKEAALTPTEERVRTFGTRDIQDQFDSLMIEDFQQEFELAYCDESYSFFPYELILPCTSDELVLADDFPSLAEPKGRLVAGFDVGRKRSACPRPTSSRSTSKDGLPPDRTAPSIPGEARRRQLLRQGHHQLSERTRVRCEDRADQETRRAVAAPRTAKLEGVVEMIEPRW
jgi:hypothetical protein